MPHKVLYVSEAPVYGGAERYLIALTEGLDRSVYDIQMLVSNRAPERLTDALSHLRVPWENIAPISGKTDIKGLRAHIRAFKKQRPDIVHFNLANPLHGQYAILAARLSSIPVCIATLHLPPRSATSTRRGRFFQRQTLGNLNALIAVCKSSRDLMVVHLGIPAEQTAVIYNGIDAAPFVPKSHAPTETPIIGAIARLTHQKGIDILLDAAHIVCEIHPRARFVIAGDGPLQPDLEAQCNRLNLQNNVSFPGECTDVPGLLQTFDMFALPSRYESFPFVVLEAMAAGLPVVAAAVDGVPEAIASNHIGLLVPPENPAALAEAIAALIVDPNLRATMSRKARRRVETDFSLSQMVGQTETLYRKYL